MSFSDSVLYSEKTSPLVLAEIISIEGALITCERAGQLFSACKGISLLIDPIPGDQAVVIDSEAGPSFVIAIVSSRSGNNSRTMTLPKKMDIRSPGQISIDAREKIRVETDHLDLGGDVCRVHFSEVSFESTLLRFTSSILSFAARKIEQIAHHIETTAHLISVYAHMATKEVSTVDRSISAQTLIESESLLSMGSKNTIIRSTDLVKVDSDQIHLG